MLIVLDTNVLVSGLLKPFSAAGTILRLVAEGRIRVLYDARILAEYREVLQRPKFAFPGARHRRPIVWMHRVFFCGKLESKHSEGEGE